MTKRIVFAVLSWLWLMAQQIAAKRRTEHAYEEVQRVTRLDDDAVTRELRSRYQRD